MKKLWKSKNFQLGFCLIIFLTLIGIFAPLISPEDPNHIAIERELCKPSLTNLLGCDSNGSDILSIIIFGTRVSLEIGVTVTFICAITGLLLGSLAGWLGGWVDTTLMRIIDIIFAFPGIILAIAIASALGPSKTNLIICLTLTGWAGYARLIRGEVLAVKNLEYIEAARSLGFGQWRILMFHIWPNIFSPLLVTATFGLAGTILAEASLSFLGIGVPPEIPSWGSLLSFGKDVILEAPHVSTFPGLAIMFSVLSFHLLGEGLRRAVDPKSDR
ncbi:MAG: ABC transporter permease [Oligoflexia bacterium]|nr:ABC transporter permease [Oligoflexia bacterium]